MAKRGPASKLVGTVEELSLSTFSVGHEFDASCSQI